MAQQKPKNELIPRSILKRLQIDLSFMLGAAVLGALFAKLLFLAFMPGTGGELELITGGTLRGWTGLFVEDLLGGLLLACVLLLCTLPFRFENRRGLVLAGALIFGAGLMYVGGQNYFRVYEIAFDWSHLKHLDGSQEILSSIQSEVQGDTYLWACLALLFSMAWYFLARAARKKESGNNSIDSEHRFLYATGRLATLILLAGAVLAGHFLYERNKTPQSPDAPLDYAHNIVYRLGLAGLISKPANHPLTRTSGNKSEQPFSFRFNSNSLEIKQRLPRLDFPRKKNGYNIVLYFVESTSHIYEGFKVNGRSVTPNLDRLRKNSLAFNNHHAQNPLSINALYSVLTSAYSLPEDRWAAQDYPNIKIKSLPELVKERGFRTALFHTGYFDYAGQRNFLKNRGFDVMQDEKQLRKAPYTETINWGVDDRALLEPALNFANAQSDSPYMMVLVPVSPHHPYDIPDESFKITTAPAGAGFKEKSFAKYINSLHYSDYVLGKLVDGIENSREGENTLLFIFGDHGEAFGQHRRNYNHPFYIYQENVQVPFLLYNKRIFKKPENFDSISRHIDILPTVCDILGIPLSPRHEGRSLLRSGLPQIAFFNTTWRNNLLGLRDGQWKFIYDRKTGGQELFDLNQDPEEKTNLHKRYPEISRRYHDYIFSLHSYQKSYYETIVGRPIDWSLKQVKN